MPFSPAFPDLAVAAGPVVGPAAAVAQTDDDPAREADKSHTNNIVDIPNHMFDNIKRLGREGMNNQLHACHQHGITAWSSTIAGGVGAGKLPELVQLFKQNQLLQATHPLNVALQNLQKHLVSQFYYAMVDTLGIPPNASSAALHIRALGQLQKLSQAEAFWKQWQVCCARPCGKACIIWHQCACSTPHDTGSSTVFRVRGTRTLLCSWAEVIKAAVYSKCHISSCLHRANLTLLQSTSCMCVQARGNPVDPVTLGALAGAYGTSGMPEVTGAAAVVN